MSTNNQDNKERRCVVWEQRKGGGRFITGYIESETYEDNEHHLIVAADVDENMAKMLCDQRQENTIKSYLDSLPEEMRSSRMDGLIANIIREGE